MGTTDSTENGQATPRYSTGDDYVPFRIDTTAPLPKVEEIELFSIDGKAYTAPARVSGPTVVRVLSVAARRGLAAGIHAALVETVPDEALEALTSCEHLTYEQIQDMLTKIGEMYYGQIMAAAGK